MANLKSRRGKASELQVIGEMLDAGLDCYLTLVDDQAIDAVLRVQLSEHSAKYFDIQIKSGRTWAAIGVIPAVFPPNRMRSWCYTTPRSARLSG